MHPTNNDGFGKPNAWNQPQQLGVQNVVHPTCLGGFGEPACSQTRTWGYLNRSDSSTGIKKMDQRSWELELSVLPFWESPTFVPSKPGANCIHFGNNSWIGWPVYTLYPGKFDISHYYWKDEKMKHLPPSYLKKLVYMWLVPWGRGPVSHASLPTENRHFHRVQQPSWGRVQPSRAPAEWYRASTSRSPGNVNFTGAK